MVLNKDFREFIRSLKENNVKYLVVGGYALGFHGYPRYTKDLEIWILTSSENAGNMLKALNEFGFHLEEISEQDFLDKNEIIQLGYPPNRIDIIMFCDGVEFDECYKNKNSIIDEDLEIDFIDIENLKKNKKATGRLQDLADLENLESL